MFSSRLAEISFNGDQKDLLVTFLICDPSILFQSIFALLLHICNMWPQKQLALLEKISSPKSKASYAASSLKQSIKFCYKNKSYHSNL